MPQPTASDIHVNAPLTNVSIAYLQDQSTFLARKVFPTVPVNKQSDRYYQYDKKQWYRTDARKRAPATESAGSGFAVDNTPTYFADVRAVHKDVDDQIRANADPVINPDRDATEFVTRDLALEAELDWAAAYFTTGIWTGSTSGGDITPSTLWDAANSTPFEDLRQQIRSAQRKGGGFKPNFVAMGPEVWDVLADHPDALDRIKHTQTGVVTPQLFAQALGVPNVWVAEAIEDTGIEGAAEALEFIYGKNVLVGYAAPRPSLLAPSAGYTFAWTGYLGANAAGMRMSRFRMEHLKSDRVEGESAYDHKLVAAEQGAFFTGVIS